MGNSTSKEGKDKQNKIESREETSMRNQAISYDNDSTVGCPTSKSTFETEFTGRASASPRGKATSERTASSKTTTSKSRSKRTAAREEAMNTASHITDDQVHVNLAMADLMAYLQVVANNSNNLPLTRRDDPELGRSVTNLTPDEYARKSAAFIPSDVRVIGGAFTRYGRVWDLPTSEEFNALDGAQEPGRSYGGACCNSMLKVLYDTANDSGDGAQAKEASDALFDDDEDEESILGKSVKSLHSLDFSPSNPSSISWATLLKRMKVEISDIEHAQTPVLTSSRKFDLNKPFSIVPDNFDPRKGKKRSLLIGCNYTNIHGAELKASHDDIGSMKDYIVNVHGFPETNDLMTILLDDDQHKHPTHLNITEAFKSLSEQSQPGDAVFIQFSGHGGRVLDSPIDSEAESYDEVIVPSDYTVSGLIRDTLIFKTLLAPMKYGVTVTILIDSCDTGMMVDMPYRWNTKNDKHDTPAKLTQNDDFSFVRFLKVVRTLYESSTFTQLGKTVGSVLNTNPNQPRYDYVSENDEEGYGTHGSLDRQETGGDETTLASTVKSNGHGTLLNALVSCTSPGGQAEDEEEDTKTPKTRANQKENKRSSNDALVPFEERSEKAPQSRSILEQMIGSRTPLVEQIINCTLVHGEDDYSDDETYNDSFAGSSTFDTATDDGSRSAPRRRRSKRRSTRR